MTAGLSATTRRRARIRFSLPLALAVILSLLSTAVGLPSWAVQSDSPQLSVSVDIPGGGAGTAPFNSDGSPGHATGALHTGTDGATIVRVNDTVTYQIDVAVNAATLTNAALDVDLPKGLWMDTVPGYCAAGSTLTPMDPFAALTAPYTQTSNEQLAPQTLHCRRGTLTNQTETLRVTARLGNLVPNAYRYVLRAVTLTGTSDGTPVSSAAATIPVVQASAALTWSLTGTGATGITGGGSAYDAIDLACGTYAGAAKYCRRVLYGVTISAASGGIGAMAPTGDVTFAQDLVLEDLLPGLTSQQYAAIRANPGKYLPSTHAQSLNIQGAVSSLQPYVKISGNQTSTTAVRDSGHYLNESERSADQVLTHTLTGTDWTLRTHPTTLPVGTALPSINGEVPAYAVSVELLVDFPSALIKDFGTKSADGLTSTLTVTHRLADLTMTGFAGVFQKGNTAIANTYLNVTRTVATYPASGLDSSIAAVPGTPGNMAVGTYDQWKFYAGLAGGATYRSKDITMVAGQPFVFASFVTSGNPSDDAQSVLTCASWDAHTAFLRAANIPKDPLATYQAAPSNGAPVWKTFDPPSGSLTSNERIQYAALPVDLSTFATSSLCGDKIGTSTVTWYDNPADVPGAQPQTLADGSTVYPAVNRVRIYADYAPIAVPAQFARTTWSISLVVNPDLDTFGDIIPVFSSTMRTYTPTSFETVTAPGANTSNGFKATRALTDAPDNLFARATLTRAQARLTQQVAVTASNAAQAPTTWGTSAGSSQAGKSALWLRLAPTFTSPVASTVHDQVSIEDCLPAGLTYTSATLTPTTLKTWAAGDSPSITCQTGETYVKWVLPDVSVNEAIAPIIVRTETSPDAKTGLRQISAAVISSPSDVSAATLRTSTQVSFNLDSVAGVYVAKHPITTQVQMNQANQPAQEDMSWQNTLVNATDKPTGRADMIDVLPTSGFTGTFALRDAATTTPHAQTWYTSNPNPQGDPQDPSNSTTGTTVWCTSDGDDATVASGAGTASACPHSSSAVTAIRWVLPEGLGAQESLEGTVVARAVGNHAGDTYTSSLSGAVVGLMYTVGPDTYSPSVVATTVSGTVWLDEDENSVLSQGDNGANGITVTLQGDDDLGNPVSDTTTTGTDGTYSFTGLRASSPSGYTVTVHAPDRTPTFVAARQGIDPSMWSSVTLAGAATVGVGKGATVTVNAGLVAYGELTWTIANTSGQALAGSSWTLTNGTRSIVVDDNATNDSDTTEGSMRVRRLEPGTWTFAQTQSPTGFAADTKTWDVTVAGGQVCDGGDFIAHQSFNLTMPFAGGRAPIALLVIAGLLLLSFAVTWLFIRRRHPASRP